jgi:hypothetical protein
MNIVIKLTHSMDQEIRDDLNRPHPFAVERVGFVSATGSMVGLDDYLIVLKKYYPVKDGDYIEDDTVGCRINGNAIRIAMQHILSSHESMFHIHLHAFKSIPSMSITDRKEIPQIVKSLCNVNPNIIHGFIIMSKTHYKGYVKIPKSGYIETRNIQFEDERKNISRG